LEGSVSWHLDVVLREQLGRAELRLFQLAHRRGSILAVTAGEDHARETTAAFS
jgi:hypothetical protein